jgi:hypothetical protein
VRVGEVLHLDRSDLDPENAVLVVRDSKFGKSKEIPLHQSSQVGPTTSGFVKPFANMLGHFRKV